MKRSLAVVILLAAGAAVLPAQAAVAADDPDETTWAVAPANAAGRDDRTAFAYAIDPGTLIHDFVVISNFSDKTEEFDLYATDAITQFDTGSFSLLPRAEAPVDIGSWIDLGVDSVQIAPGQAVAVPFVVVVPSDATPGDHTAGIVASTTSTSTDANGQQVAFEKRIAARVYMRISGDAIAAVEATGLVEGFIPSWNPFSGGTANVDYAVSNTGNLRVDVAQDVVFRGPFGIELGHITTIDPVVNLLPGQAAHVHVEATGIAPLLLLWGAVTLTPGEPTDQIANSHEQKADGSPADPRPEVTYRPVTAEAVTGALSWILIVIVVLVIAVIWLIVRYVRVTRDRMYDAIDAATEQARQEAQREAERVADTAS